MIDIRSFRFTIPPFVLFFVIWWGIFTDSSVSLDIIIGRVLPEKLREPSTILVTSVFFFFGIGFVISTIGTFIQRLAYLSLKRFSGPGVMWDREAEKKLNESFNLEQLRKEGEICQQAVLSQVPQVLHKWVSRRWEYFQINLNSLIAVVGAIVIMILLEINPNLIGYLGIGVFLCLLGFNMVISWKDGTKMVHFVLRNIDNLSHIPRRGKPKENKELKKGLK